MRTDELTDFGLGPCIHDFDPTSADAPGQTGEIQHLIYEHALVQIRDSFAGMDNDSERRWAHDSRGRV